MLRTRLAHGARKRFDAAVRGVVEIELVRVAFGFDTDGSLDHVFDGRLGDAAFHPFQTQFFGGNVPDFLVVGDQIFLGESLAEVVVDPLLEIGLGRRIVVLDVVVEALEAILRLEIEEAVFERVFYVAAFVENLVVAARAVDVIAEQRHHVIHHLLIAREDDVRAAGVVGKAVLLDGLAVAAAPAFLFEHFAIVVQMRRDGEARQPAA